MKKRITVAGSVLLPVGRKTIEPVSIRKVLIMDEVREKFRIRLFVTEMIAFCALGLLVTGVFNHIHGFSPLTTARHAWMAAHNVLGLLFVFFSIWHVALNRRMFWNHIKKALRGGSIACRETLLVGVILLLAMLSVSHAFLL